MMIDRLGVPHATVDHQAADPALLSCHREDLTPVTMSGTIGIDHEDFARLGYLKG